MWAQRWRLQDVRCLAQVPARGGETEEQRYGQSGAARSCLREGLGGHSLEHLLFLSWARGKKLLGLWLLFTLCALAGGSRIILISCMSYIFQMLDFFFFPLTFWVFSLFICHGYYCSKVDLGVPQSLTRFPSSRVGAVTLQGEALECWTPPDCKGVMVPVPPYTPSRRGVGWKDEKSGRIMGRKSTLRRSEGH